MILSLPRLQITFIINFDFTLVLTSSKSKIESKALIISPLAPPPQNTPSKFSLMINLFQFLIGLFLLSFLFFVAQYLLLQVQINVPPASLGIAVLFCGLLWIKGVPKAISNAANPLLAHMSLFFIPAIVAIVNFIDLIVAFPLALFFSIVVSTLVSLAITAWISQRLMHKLDITNGNSDKPPREGD